MTDSTRPAMWATSSSECSKTVQCVGLCVDVFIIAAQTAKRADSFSSIV